MKELKVSFGSEPMLPLLLERPGSRVVVVEHRAIFMALSQHQWVRLGERGPCLREGNVFLISTSF